jgi:Tol biopolymer transport system component
MFTADVNGKDRYIVDPYGGTSHFIWRDPHPRFSPNGKHVVIDSTHEGLGRQMYLIDISRIVVGTPS